MERLKNNIMLIVLSVVIVCCTLSVNHKLEGVIDQLQGTQTYISTNLPTFNDISKIYGTLNNILNQLN